MLRPIQDLILCEVLPDEEKTQGGIFLPQTTRQRQNKAKVLSTGRGIVSKRGALKEPRVRKGDIVLFDPYKIEHVLGEETTNTPYAGPGKQFLIRESNIFATIEAE